MRIFVTANAAAGLLAVAGLLAAAPAAAQNAIADFYRGKTVTIAAGSSAGGGLDTYGRLVARHLGRFIPGNPTVIVQNMPGAGSLTAARHLYSVAPKDGTHIATVLPSALLESLIGSTDRKTYDPTRFNYLGNANSETLVCVTRRDAPVKHFSEVFEKELIVGSTGPGSTLQEGPAVSKNLLGAKINIVAGYKGSREVSLAVLKNEIHGVCGLAWSSAKQQYQDLLDPNGVVQILVQEDSKPHPELQGRAPLTIDFAKTAEQRAVLEIFYSQAIFTRPFLLPPDVPEARVAALRKAFMETMKSEELQAEARKQQTEAAASPGEDVEALIRKIYATPPEIVEQLKKASGK